MKHAVPIMAALLALSACGGVEPAAPPAQAPTIRLAAIPGRPASGYFQLRISGDRGALLSVTSPQAGRIEMHETMARGTMTAMRPIARLPVRDGELLVFAPGGRHLMLFDLAPTVRPGGHIRLIFNFERGEPQALDASVAAAGGD